MLPLAVALSWVEERWLAALEQKLKSCLYFLGDPWSMVLTVYLNFPFHIHLHLSGAFQEEMSPFDLVQESSGEVPSFPFLQIRRQTLR